MHKSENEKIDFILDEHEQMFRKQGSLCMALGKGFLVIAILCGVATFCVSGLYLKSLCLSVACCCGVFCRILHATARPFSRTGHSFYRQILNTELPPTLPADI